MVSSGGVAQATRTDSEGKAEAMAWRAEGRASGASAGRQTRSSAVERRRGERGPASAWAVGCGGVGGERAGGHGRCAAGCW